MFDNCTNGEGNFDAFLPESGGEGLDEFVFQAELTIKVGGVEQDVEINAAVAKIEKTHGGLSFVVQLFIEVGEYLTGNVKSYVLDFLQVAVIGYAYGNFDYDIVMGHAVVGDDGGGDFLIGDYNHIAFAYGNNGGKTPSDICYPSFLTGA